MKVVALVSGGIDSTVMLWKLRSEGHSIVPLTLLTFRRNPKEIEAAKKISQTASGREPIVYDVSFLRELFDYPQHIKERVFQHFPSLPNIVIPYRNIIFYSVAAYVACHEEAEAIAGGHTREDMERIPDVGEEFFTELEKILNKSTPFYRVKILTPVAGFWKPEILRLGLELGAPIGETWSCWSIFEKHCGKCPGCVSRREVFKAVGILDPTEYLEG
ncbi:MAG: 7-cyano-7-deazaguanine synthase [Candidatus Caldarchaeum sp.]